MIVARSIASGALALALLLGGGAARAFPSAGEFDADSVEGVGGEGVRFTGSPSFLMGTCASCHTGAEGRIGIRLGAAPASLFSDGYEPGATYELEVELTDEHLATDRDAAGPRCGNAMGKYILCNTNGFQLEADAVDGTPVGALCPVAPAKDGSCPAMASAEAQRSMDGTSIAASNSLIPAGGGLPAGLPNGTTRWHLFWIAPGAGTGPVTFHVGVVDGNGGSGDKKVLQDPEGDDVAAAHISVDESGTTPPAATTAGCHAAPDASDPGALPIVLAAVGALLLFRPRKRNPRTRSTA